MERTVRDRIVEIIGRSLNIKPKKIGDEFRIPSATPPAVLDCIANELGAEFGINVVSDLKAQDLPKVTVRRIVSFVSAEKKR